MRLIEEIKYTAIYNIISPFGIEVEWLKIAYFIIFDKNIVSKFFKSCLFHKLFHINWCKCQKI